MTGFTRRDALRGVGAAVVVVGVPTAVQAGDPAFVVSQQLRAAWRAWLAAMRAFDEIDNCGIPTCGIGGPGCVLRQKQEQCEARFFELQARLLNTPATTLNGVLGKLGSFYGDAEIVQIVTGEEPEPLPGDYVASIYFDLERLSGEGSS